MIKTQLVKQDNKPVAVIVDGLVKSPKSPPPWRGRVRERVISGRIPVCYFPLPLIPSR